MALHIRCYGKVQGVFFRASTKNEADNLGVTGWVRNEPDGTVMIHAEGERVKELLEWTKKGPQFAVVKSVEFTEVDDKGMESFEIRR
ncbi:MAG: acylphosphatase [Marinoscillum sp.]